jgi:hypothetical protein
VATAAAAVGGMEAGSATLPPSGAWAATPMAGAWAYIAPRIWAIAYPYFYGGYYAYNAYYGDCSWLYRRAVATGTRYRWNRYHACVG